MSDQGQGWGGPPRGWYPDPQRSDQQRWWDGTRWTEHTAPAGPPASGGWPSGPGQPWGGASPAPYGQPQVETWLWQSIAVTLLCCMPLGIAGIVFAAQAQGAVSSGDYAEARRKADTARSLTIAGFVIGLLFLPVLFLMGV